MGLFMRWGDLETPFKIASSSVWVEPGAFAIWPRPQSQRGTRSGFGDTMSACFIVALLTYRFCASSPVWAYRIKNTLWY